MLTKKSGVLSPLQLWIKGWSQSTTIGATYLALVGGPTRAFARASMSALAMPRMPLKMPGSVFLARTLMVSFGSTVEETVMFPPATSPPFLFA